jgi:hypothetical protein
MPEKLQPIEQLAALLQHSGAEPVIVPSRLAPSAIYDVEYRTTIVALVFERFAKPPAPSDHRKIASSRLKLLQFITLRPWLLTAIRQWGEAGEQSGFAFSHSLRIRRGFLSDTAHDDVINYLVARGIFLRNDTQIVSGKNAAALTEIAQSIVEQDLFSSERRVMEHLGEIKITNAMLEGW